MKVNKINDGFIDSIIITIRDAIYTDLLENHNIFC